MINLSLKKQVFNELYYIQLYINIIKFFKHTHPFDHLSNEIKIYLSFCIVFVFFKFRKYRIQFIFKVLLYYITSSSLLANK
jgi:hypothetical protein